MAADAVAIADAVVAMKKVAVAAEAKKAKKKAKAADAAVAVVAVTNRISYTYYNKSRESSFAAFIYIYIGVYQIAERYSLCVIISRTSLSVSFIPCEPIRVRFRMLRSTS